MSARELSSSAPSSEKKKKKKRKRDKNEMNSVDAGESSGNPAAVPTGGDLDPYSQYCLIESRSPIPVLDNSTWPNLLANYDRLNVRTGQYGHSPLNRPLEIYLRYGVINLDKHSHEFSHQVAARIKDIFRAEKTGHSDILSRNVTGSLVVFMNRSTRLIKSLHQTGMEYVCIARLHSAVPDTAGVARAIKTLTGTVFQCPPVKRPLRPVKQQLRSRTIYNTELLGYDPQELCVQFWISCEAGTNVKNYCVNLGLLLGVGAHMHQQRRVRSGFLGKRENTVTIEDVIDAQSHYEKSKDESYLRKVVMPVETLLTNYKRLVVQDSAVYALCHGGKLMIAGLLRFENYIEKGEEIVIITTKEGAIGIGVAKMTSALMLTSNSGIVAKVKRVVMDTDMYPRHIQQI